MKRVQISTLVAVLALVLAEACFGQIWQETRITGDGASPRTPKTWGGDVYWADSRNYQTGYDEIRKWTPSTGETVLRQVPWAWGTTIQGVYQDNLVLLRGVASGNYDLYLWNANAGTEVPVTTAPGIQKSADVYQNTVVWEDHRGTYSQIYMWDPVNGERAVYPSGSNQTNPKIWGDLVTWEDDRRSDYFGGKKDVYRWSPGIGEQLVAYDSRSPVAYDGKIVGSTLAYYDPYFPHDYHPGTLWQWSSQGGITILDPNTTGYIHTDMWGDLIAAAQGKAWDPVHGPTSYSLGDQYADYPSVYGNQVAWVSNNNIYLSTLVPEPSGIITLACLAVALGVVALTRRPKREEAVS